VIGRFGNVRPSASEAANPGEASTVERDEWHPVSPVVRVVVLGRDHE
jgi:hypothetical protein